MLEIYEGEGPIEKQHYYGEAEFDLARYAKSPTLTERLTITGKGETAYIEVTVKS